MERLRIKAKSVDDRNVQGPALGDFVAERTALADEHDWLGEKNPAANLVLLREKRLFGRAVEEHRLGRLDLERRRALRHPRGVLAVVRSALLLPRGAWRRLRRLLLALAVIAPVHLIEVEEAKPRFPDQRLHLASQLVDFRETELRTRVGRIRVDARHVEIALAILGARECAVVVRNRHKRQKRIRRIEHVVLKPEIPLLYVPGGEKVVGLGEERHIALAGRICGKDDALLVAAVPYAVRVSGVGADEVRDSRLQVDYTPLVAVAVVEREELTGLFGRILLKPVAETVLRQQRLASVLDVKLRAERRRHGRIERNKLGLREKRKVELLLRQLDLRHVELEGASSR